MQLKLTNEEVSVLKELAQAELTERRRTTAQNEFYAAGMRLLDAVLKRGGSLVGAEWRTDRDFKHDLMAHSVAVSQWRPLEPNQAVVPLDPTRFMFVGLPGRVDPGIKGAKLVLTDGSEEWLRR